MGEPIEGPAYRVSFVCSGNICRSPSAEVITRALLAERGLSGRVQVDSYGTGPWEVGNAAWPPALRALRGRGYDGTAHVARQVGAEQLASYDLVLALDAGHLRELRRLRGRAQSPEIRLLREYDETAATLDVDDPYGSDDEMGDDGIYQRVLDEIEAACRGLVERLATRVGAPAGTGDR